MGTLVVEQVITEPLPLREVRRDDFHAGGIVWPAIFGGAVVVAAVNLVLLTLGAGLGLSTFSPWSSHGESLRVIGTPTVVWYFVMQFVAGSLGGYLAGRLRSRWRGVHGDEVYFRDTAHGLIAWGLAFVVTVGFLATASTVLSGAALASPRVATAEQSANPNAYYVDLLLRTSAATPDSVPSPVRGELGRIFSRAMIVGDYGPDDLEYASRVINAHAGIGTTAAGARLASVLVTARQDAETASRATGHTLLWIFAALLLGAFAASIMAMIGGRQRDHVLPA